MTALSEALHDNQRAVIVAARKAFLAGTLNESDLLEMLDDIGCRDVADQGQFLAQLHALQRLGTEAPRNGAAQPQTAAQKPATQNQWTLASKIANERGYVLPDESITSAKMSAAIDSMKAGTYNADDYTVPF